ncbi:carbohydrate ABC transporter permease [Salinibacterium sp. GXW1014]|uniref:carbohydrate ABC transporter permease n=1 Tax=Salinibacterium sp. GXW1014 TaxID=3377838 RepID=UPI00383B9060
MAFTLVAQPEPTTDAAPVRQRTSPLQLGRMSLAHFVMAVVAIASVFPIVWLFATAVAPAAAILTGDVFSGSPTLDNLRYVSEAIPLAQMMVNSFLMSVAITAAQLIVAVFASYGFAVFEFPGKKALYLLFIGSWLVPFQVTMIPNYVLIAQMGMLNSILGIIVPNLCSAFAVIMLRQHMRGIPRELLEASTIDGRSSWGTLWLVVVPNLKAALSSLAVILFISAWNEYLWPVLVMQQETSVIQVGIRSFLSAEGNNWGAVMAASGIACLPVFLLYVLLQRQVVDGFVRSGLK